MKKVAEVAKSVVRRLAIQARRDGAMEKANPIPIEGHVPHQRINPEVLQYLMHPAWQHYLDEEELESEEDANDFHMEEAEKEDLDFRSKYEVIDMIEEYPVEAAESPSEARSAETTTTQPEHEESGQEASEALSEGNPHPPAEPK